jgi:hypothetical protein
VSSGAVEQHFWHHGGREHYFGLRNVENIKGTGLVLLVVWLAHISFIIMVLPVYLVSPLLSQNIIFCDSPVVFNGLTI